ncbi:hypothetical protein [Thioalkalivibrio sp. ALE11]|uniref:hypothetical protein n=1 Tax=Thioalkalivibrio sp. ALE11 TaxID=1265494 RepID=UPI000363E700|nr:hypothetical protein [Thioalkalivibrio sp. ALE11]
MAVTVLLWILAIVIAIGVLDLARQPLRRFLVALAGAVARGVCALRRQVLHLRDAVRDWHGGHLERLEAERIHSAVEALERRYGEMVGHDLAQLPALRQQARDTLRVLDEAYQRDEQRLIQEPEWVERLEALARGPASDTPESRRLAQDMEDTVLRIARSGLEEQRRSASALLSARRRADSPLREMVGNLERVQERLARLERQGERLDRALGRCEEVDRPVRRALPAHAQAATQWLMGAAGLALAALAVVVHQHVFGPALAGMFPETANAPGAMAPGSEWMLYLLLGTAALAGWVLAESRGVTRVLPHALMEGGGWAPRVLAGLSIAVLVLVAAVSAFTGFHLDWLIYQHELVTLLLEGEERALPAGIRHAEQLVGAALGLLIPLLLALVPVWVVGFLQATRILAGGVLSAGLGVLAGILYLAAVGACQLRRLLPATFELIIFVPAAIRRWLAARRNGA